jgi:rfaE bifunctional protein kinase chain/domain
MTPERLEELLAQIPGLRIVVIGDFFLDKYMVTDPALSERSLETGLEARQVVEVRCSPGAAGTVTNNLSALGVGRIEAVGVIGDDGEGYELLRGLRSNRVETDGLLPVSTRFTPTYTKPMVRTPEGEQELERLDIKNRAPLSPELETRVIDELTLLLKPIENRQSSIANVNAVIIADQVEERDCGVISDRIRAALAELAAENPGVVFFADSRVRIGEFRGVTVKPNRHEAAHAVHPHWTGSVTRKQAEEFGWELAARNGRAVFLTIGEEGILVCTPDSVAHVPAPRVEGPIDIVGAGDSATAGIVCALCAGANLTEAAFLGNLCASVTIRKLGTTGTASPEELRQAHARL